jgi:hypothetical protein
LSKVTLLTLVCFSLAGLIAGFGLGGFVGHTSGLAAGTGSPSIKTPQLTAHSPGIGSSPAPENIFLGEPLLRPGDYTSPEKADGATSYQLSAQIVNKNTNTPITASDVTCRLWLTDDAKAMATALSDNNYALPRTISSFNQPFPHEIAGALNFTAPSQQVQPCSANGKTSWTYTLSPNVQPGSYFLAVLADWKGVHYNWYMAAIKIPNGGNAGN